MFLKFDPCRVWCSIFYSKLVNCILFKIIVQHIRFVKGRGTWDSGKETLKFGSIFGSLPDFPSLRPEVKRERSQVALFLLCVVSPAHMDLFTIYNSYKPIKNWVWNQYTSVGHYNNISTLYKGYSCYIVNLKQL